MCKCVAHCVGCECARLSEAQNVPVGKCEDDGRASGQNGFY